MGVFRFVGMGVLTAKGMAALERGITESADDVEAAAKEEAPEDTGSLSGGIHVEGVQVSGSSVEAKVTTGPETDEGGTQDYAIYVHEGARSRAGRPFMTHALLDNASGIENAVGRAAREVF